MDQVISDIAANLAQIPHDQINGRGQRRFRDAIEIPLTAYLGLEQPSGTCENVYVTWVDASNNIDNRLWQTQNKLIRGNDPRIAVALCPSNITADRMWEESARNLSRLAPYLNENNFEGLVIFATPDDRVSWIPSRLVLLRGGGIAEQLSHAIPEISPDWYTVPLATRRPTQGRVQSEPDRYVQMLKAHRNVILKGVSGIGKSHVVGPIIERFDESDFVVFHPNSTYEDFVEALRPSGGGQFQVTDGRFLAFCKKAAANPHKEFLFVIDEINRAPAARVLGDLLYAIDPSKRVNALVAHQVLSHDDGSLPLSIDLDRESRPVRLQHERTGQNGPYRALFCVPDNVYILATRNTSDHSIGTMDIALGRRFKTERLEPLSAESLIAVLTNRDNRLAFLQSEVVAWSRMNTVLDSVSPDACLGHSYFFDALRAADNVAAAEDSSLITQFLWRDYLLPQLAEVLTTFDASHLLPSLDEAAGASTTSTGGYWVEARGQGLDVAYLVQSRLGATTESQPTAALPEVSLDDDTPSNPEFDFDAEG